MTNNETEDKQTVFKEEAGASSETATDAIDASEVTSIGLQPNLAGLLCYLFGFVSGIVFLIIEKENDFVRYHAMQSIVTWVFLFILAFILGAIPLVGWAIGLLLFPVYIVFWVFLMWKAYQNVRFKLPVVSELVENFLGK